MYIYICIYIYIYIYMRCVTAPGAIPAAPTLPRSCPVQKFPGEGAVPELLWSSLFGSSLLECFLALPRKLK